ncbi:helicase SKI2W-like [Amblyraja radiata]|uniref:helicase SKI2W-like n=1 Tax=Amblyraja radiata TaxID=386614 RepID=UPI001401DC65|nr:helicase SKI2W-like [Amblyraja radiata]
MSLREFNKIRNTELMKNDSSTLHAYRGEVLHPLEKAGLKCTVNEQTKNLMFYIVQPNSESLLGISACHDLGLVYFWRAARLALKGPRQVGGDDDPEVRSWRASVALLFAVSGSFVALPITVIHAWVGVSETVMFRGTRSLYAAVQVAMLLKCLGSCTNTCVFALTQSRFRTQMIALLTSPCAERTNSVPLTPQKMIMESTSVLKALSAGRVVVVKNRQHNNALGVILQVSTDSGGRTFTALVLCEARRGADEGEDDGGTLEEEPTAPTPEQLLTNKLFLPEGPCGHAVVKLTPADIGSVTVKTLRINADKIIDDFKKRQIPRFRSDAPGASVTAATQELVRLAEGSPGGVASLDPVSELQLRDLELVEVYSRARRLGEALSSYKCVHSPRFSSEYTRIHERMVIKDELERLCYLVSDQSLLLLPEYQQRIQVLKRLHYVDSSSAVQLKGRVACEISSHELLVTEMVLENVLTELQPEEIVALLSCMVFPQKSQLQPQLSATLQQGVERIRAVAERVTALQRDCGVRDTGEDYVEQLRFGLVHVVYEWARGMPFAQITRLTDVQEGIIVRCIQRLNETCRDVRSAARIIGDPTLHAKMEQASQLIKRDIVFAASLYTQ